MAALLKLRPTLVWQNDYCTLSCGVSWLTLVAASETVVRLRGRKQLVAMKDLLDKALVRPDNEITVDRFVMPRTNVKIDGVGHLIISSAKVAGEAIMIRNAIGSTVQIDHLWNLHDWLAAVFSPAGGPLPFQSPPAALQLFRVPGGLTLRFAGVNCKTPFLPDAIAGDLTKAMLELLQHNDNSCLSFSLPGGLELVLSGGGNECSATLSSWYGRDEEASIEITKCEMALLAAQLHALTTGS